MNHVISRSVRDSACMLDATHGPEVGAPYRLAAPERPYRAEAEHDPAPLKIAFTARSPLGTAVDPEAVAAVARTAKLLEDLGHHVEQAEPNIDGAALAQDFLQVWLAHHAYQMRKTRADLAAPPTDFELDSLLMETFARTRLAVDYVESYVRWTEYGYQLSEFLTRYDLYMTPTVAAPPPRIGALDLPPPAATTLRAALRGGLGPVLTIARGVFDRVVLENMVAVPFTQLANVTGVPAMSVPLHTFANGMPLGIQFIAEHGGEGLLFSLAGQLERAANWHERRPNLEA